MFALAPDARDPALITGGATAAVAAQLGILLCLQGNLAIRDKANLDALPCIWRLTSLMAVRLAAVATLGASFAAICGDARVVEASAIWVSIG